MNTDIPNRRIPMNVLLEGYTPELIVRIRNPFVDADVSQEEQRIELAPKEDDVPDTPQAGAYSVIANGSLGFNSNAS